MLRYILIAFLVAHITLQSEILTDKESPYLVEASKELKKQMRECVNDMGRIVPKLEEMKKGVKVIQLPQVLREISTVMDNCSKFREAKVTDRCNDTIHQANMYLRTNWISLYTVFLHSHENEQTALNNVLKKLDEIQRNCSL